VDTLLHVDAAAPPQQQQQSNGSHPQQQYMSEINRRLCRCRLGRKEKPGAARHYLPGGSFPSRLGDPYPYPLARHGTDGTRRPNEFANMANSNNNNNNNNVLSPRQAASIKLS